MLARCETDAREGLWIRAERQIAGRGRLGRPWQGRMGNFYASTCVILQPQDPPAASLAFVAGLAVFHTLAPYLGDHAPQLKWPNDVLVNNRKLAGILLERKGQVVIVGIGINVTHAPDVAGRDITCLHDEGAPLSLDAAIIAEELAAEFARLCNSWRSEHLDRILDKWSAHAHKAGTIIRVSQGPESGITGIYRGLGPDGSLRIDGNDGTAHVIHAGDVEIVRNLER